MIPDDQMMERQQVLADFGDFALRSDDLQEVLTEGCRLVVQALRAKFAKVVEIQPDRETVLVRAGVGWKPGIVGEVQLPLNARTSEAHAIAVGEPVITRDIGKEDRFGFPDFMKDHGVVSIINVPIFTPGGEAYGLLQVDSIEPREFDRSDIQFLRTYAVILGPVIDRLHKVQDLRRSFEVQQRLLKELQHRVRNNIGVISSLVRIRARGTSSPEAAAELSAVGQRIESLRLVHEQLYIGGAADRLQLRPYASQLLNNLVELYKHQSGPVRLDIECPEVEFDADTAVPLGLIFNEFATNSLKYAFDGKGGRMSLNVEVQEDCVCIRLSDNGKGLPAQPAAAKPGAGMGIGLIDGLANQIGAKTDWASSSEGTMLCLEFRPPEDA